MIGWAAAYHLIDQGKVDTLADAFLLLVALAGIFGFLPYMLSQTKLK
jgi:hypothetical protein